MKKFCIILLIVSAITVVSAYVNSPPSGTTNAPGETKCSTTPLCHTGKVNRGPGRPEITFPAYPGLSLYRPGKTYRVAPFLKDSTTHLKGFEMVVKNNGHGPNGKLRTLHPKTSQVIEHDKQYYAVQTRAGATNPRHEDWTVEWKAPPPGSGTVTFYAAFVGANGNGLASGDSIYTYSVSLREDTITSHLDGDQFPPLLRYVCIYPLPFKNKLKIRFKTKQKNIFHLSLMNLHGRIIRQNEFSPGPSGSQISLNTSGIPSGPYLLHLECLKSNHNKNSKTIKIFKY